MDMDTAPLKQKLQWLINDLETRYETLSLLCELAPLGHKELMSLGQERLKVSSFRVNSELAIISKVPAPTQPHSPNFKINEALGLVDQLQSLILDMEILFSLNPSPRETERLRRKLMLEATKMWIRRVRLERDDRVLAILAAASEKLGEFVLTKPEGWVDEGVGILLAELALLDVAEVRCVSVRLFIYKKNQYFMIDYIDELRILPVLERINILYLNNISFNFNNPGFVINNHCSLIYKTQPQLTQTHLIQSPPQCTHAPSSTRSTSTTTS